jgi:hypothetical protein
MELDSASRAALSALPAHERYDALLDDGLLAGYYGALERSVAARAEVLRRETRAVAREIVFVFRVASPPADWFTLGLLAGFSGSATPVALWTRGPEGPEIAADLRRRGIPVLHAAGILPNALSPSAWRRLGQLIAEESDGFWVEGSRLPPGALTDSVARLFRRLRSLP